MDGKYHILSRVLAALLILVCAAFIAIQSPKVQTRLTQNILERINEGFKDKGANISIDLISIQPDGTLLIKDATLLDKMPYSDPANDYGFEPQDTILHFNTISVTFSLKNLFKNDALWLRKAVVDGGTVNIVCEPCDYLKQLPNIKRALGLPPFPQKKGNEADVFEISKVELNNIHVTLRNYVKQRKDRDDNCIDWNDFDCTASVKAERLSFRKGIMRGKVIDAYALEKGGYELTHVEGKARVGHGITLVENARLLDKWSDIYLPHLVMSYKNAAAFRDFNDKVHLDIRPSRSLISSKTLQYFTHLSPDSNALLDLKSGHFNGYVNNAYLDKFSLVERLSNFPLNVDGTILGLGRQDVFSIDIKAGSPSFTTASLERFIKGMAPASKVGLSRFAKDKTLSINATALGKLSNLKISTYLGGNMGDLTAIFRMKNIYDEEDIEIKGDFDLKGIDLGAFLDKEAFGLVDASASVESKFTDEGPSIIIDSLRIDRLGIKGYDYNSILAKGKMTNEYFDGTLGCTDPNVDLDFSGLINYGFKGDMLHSVYKADVRNFDLSKTHLFERWETAKIRADIFADYFATCRTDGIGNWTIDSLSLDNGIEKSEFERIDLQTYEERDMYHLEMNSSIADIGISSDIDVPNAIKGLCKATIIREIPGLLPKIEDSEAETGNLMIDIKVKDASQVLAFFYPVLGISKGTSLQLNSDRDGSVNALFSSRGIRFKDKEFNGLDLSLDNLYESLNVILTADEVKFGKMNLKESTFTTYIDNRDINASLSFSGKGEDDLNGDIYLKGNSRKLEDGSELFLIKPLPSSIVLRESEWRINESEIEISRDVLKVSDFIISNGPQRLEADGVISKTGSDTLKLFLQNLDLASACELTGKDLGLNGTANGKASIFSSPETGKIIIGRVSIDKLNIKDCDFGDISVSSVWNESTHRLDLGLLNKNVKKNSISANGSYVPKTKTLTGDISLGNLSMELLSALVPKSIAQSGGSISGNLSLLGQNGQFDINSDGLTLNDLLIRPKATNVPYTINGTVRMRNSCIEMPELIVRDSDDGTGTISGKIAHKSFKNLNFGLNLALKDLTLLDLTENAEKLYGKFAADAQVSLNGPLKALNIVADVTTSSPGELHLPLASTITQKQSDLLTFRKTGEDSVAVALDAEAQKLFPSEKSDISIKCRIAATEDLRAFIEIDKENDNIIEACGNGIINAELRPAKKTSNLSGDYNITDGQYHFTALGSLIRKDFTINEGSSIKFGGAVKDTKLDVSTTYSLKTSLSALIADSTSVATRREVNCGINIGNDIKSPSLSFSINIPDLDPTTKSKVEGALNTEDKVQRQFVSLLLTNSFYPAEQSGVSYNDSNILYSNISSIMSGQVNSILKKLDIPIDLGLSYLKNEVGTNIFDVAVSTQLFNNRVQINGSVGNRQRSTSADKDVVGNIDIGIKLDKEGKLQVKLFSHSSDDYTKFLDNGQKNGLGISFQKEFKNKRSSADSTRTIFIE